MSITWNNLYIPRYTHKLDQCNIQFVYTHSPVALEGILTLTQQELKAHVCVSDGLEQF